jgi:HK97 family phage prohead protease
MEGLDNFIKDRKSLGITNFRSLPLEGVDSKVEVTDNNEVKGYAIVWGSKNSYDEIVLKGATLNSLNARGVGTTKNKIVLLNQHNLREPIGEMLELREDDYGLYFRAKLVDTDSANTVKEQINGGVLRQLSYGFDYIWDAVEYDDQRDAYILKEIKLWEISVVTLSSDDNAQLRSFGEFQKNETIKSFSLRSLNELKSLLDKEISSRDEHLKREVDEPKSNVNLF